MWEISALLRAGIIEFAAGPFQEHAVEAVDVLQSQLAAIGGQHGIFFNKHIFRQAGGIGQSGDIPFREQHMPRPAAARAALLASK